MPTTVTTTEYPWRIADRCGPAFEEEGLGRPVLVDVPRCVHDAAAVLAGADLVLVVVGRGPLADDGALVRRLAASGTRYELVRTHADQLVQTSAERENVDEDEVLRRARAQVREELAAGLPEHADRFRGRRVFAVSTHALHRVMWGMPDLLAIIHSLCAPAAPSSPRTLRIN